MPGSKGRGGGKGLKYNIFLPEREAGAPPAPVIVFLHGQGESGDDPTVMRAQSLPKRLDDDRGFEFAVIAPQCPTECLFTQWSAAVFAEVVRLLKWAIAEHSLDPKRVYLAGQSMGGAGAWQLASMHPQLFAAVVPICGYYNGDRSKVAAALRGTPVWAFHSIDDVVIDVGATDDMVAKLREEGNTRVKYTRYETAPAPPGYPQMKGHNAYDLAFADTELYIWLLKQQLP
mmetsp:Transcript_47723/g.152993  ORF Transcript_47723/g.152993 Transcript_47723/m.152993 type:complete len:230 (+) Transcript_47723:1155-1844(+)